MTSGAKEWLGFKREVVTGVPGIKLSLIFLKLQKKHLS